MEDKPTGDGRKQPSGCFVCNTALPLLERCWSEATRDHFRNSRIEFLKGDAQPDRRPHRAPFEGRRAQRNARYGGVTPSSRSSAAGW